MMWRNRISVIILMWIGLYIPAFGQTFGYKAELDTVSKTGFYAIAFKPKLSRFTMVDLRDLRILDEKGNAVPYIIKSTLPLFDSVNYQPLKIISNELSDSGSSIVVIENRMSIKFTDFSLQIKNAVVSRTIDLSGSDDHVHWFSIKENVQLDGGQFTGNDNYFEDIDFPISSYRYFKLVIHNGKNDPLNIISAGRFLKSTGKKLIPYSENPRLKWTEIDSSDHFSYVIIDNPELYQVGYIQLEVEGPRYFKRHVDILSSCRSLGDFTIVADSVFTFYLPVFKDSVWQIRIENGDNPPLKLRSVSTGLEIKKIVAYFHANSRYDMVMNSLNAPLPEYDLQSFRDSIPFDLPEIKISEIEPITDKNAKTEKVFFKQVWVWPVILMILLLLGYFTYRLSRDVAGKRS